MPYHLLVVADSYVRLRTLLKHENVKDAVECRIEPGVDWEAAYFSDQSVVFTLILDEVDLDMYASHRKTGIPVDQWVRVRTQTDLWKKHFGTDLVVNRMDRVIIQTTQFHWAIDRKQNSRGQLTVY